MSLLGVFDKVKNIWASWDLRSFLILSFAFQCILIVTASMRKRRGERTLLGFICLAYLLADWAAYYAIGLIPTGSNEPDKYSDLHAFWAPFFLLHLGGPNTIAGFSVEDNELWKRSVLHLFVQAGMTLYIIYRAIPRNPLLGATLLLFVAASTRYVERVMALYYASMDKFRRSVAKGVGHVPNLSSLNENRGTGRAQQRRQISEVQLVKDSYILFQNYKGVFGSLPIKFDDNLNQSKDYLLKVLDQNQAFEAMEIQMNLAYEVFYTKMWLIMEQRIGKSIHIVSLCCEAAALSLWAVYSDKRRFSPVDIRLTHTLIVGAVLVHAFSFFTVLFSDLLIPKLPELDWIGFVLNQVLSIRRYRFGRLLFSRWSKTMPQFNLMDYILKGRHKQPEVNPVIRFIGSFIGPKKHGKRVVLSENVRKRVFKRIQYMAPYADTQGKAESLCLEIGAYLNMEYRWKELKDILTCAGLVDALLVCHLATELLQEVDPRYKSPVCKQLSEYLICLLVDEPTMVGSDGVGIKTSMFEDTCEHLRRIYEGEDMLSWSGNVKEELEEVKKSRGDTTMRRHMLRYAHYIKDHLKGLQRETAVEIIEDLWVELLCHMAVQCRAWAHLEQLSSGGELLTVAWLLMTYTGLTANFEPQSDRPVNNTNNGV